jgi:hypothetical protein
MASVLVADVPNVDCLIPTLPLGFTDNISAVVALPMNTDLLSGLCMLMSQVCENIWAIDISGLEDILICSTAF